MAGAFASALAPSLFQNQSCPSLLLATALTAIPSALPRLLPWQWHPKINQLFVGCGGRSGGSARAFYDPKLSSRGALLAAARAPRAATTDFMQVCARVWMGGWGGWVGGGGGGG